MSGVSSREIKPDDHGVRLDRWFKRHFPHIPHGRVEKFFRTGQVRLDGRRVKGNVRVEAGQIVRIPPLPDPSRIKVKPKISEADINFMRGLVIYEDDELIALNKPFGLACQGGSKTVRHIDGLLPALGPNCRLVHRLDRDTTGVLLIAKSARAATEITRSFQKRQTDKIYWGVTNGVPKPVSGEIKGFIAKGKSDASFGHARSGRDIMVAARHGAEGAKHARTLYQAAAMAGSRAAWMVMKPLTGRTHQLRLHMQLLGAPIAGDGKYLTDRPLPGGLENKLHLHAREISLPRDGRPPLMVQAPLPAHMIQAFNILGFDQKGERISEIELLPWDEVS